MSEMVRILVTIFFGRISIIFYPETRNHNRNLNRTRIFAFCVVDGKTDYDYD